MNTYKVTIIDDFFGKELTGQFEAETEEQAKQEAKEHYAYELDTDMDSIKIVKVERFTDEN